MKKFGLIVFVLSIFSVFGTNAQNNPYEKTFSDYASYLNSEYGINCHKPRKLKDQKKFFIPMAIRENANSGFLYGPIFLSRDKNAMVMYPSLPLNFTKSDIDWENKISLINSQAYNESSPQPKLTRTVNDKFPRAQVESEIKASLNLIDENGRPLPEAKNFDLDDYLTIIAGKEARRRFNADTIYLYNLPLEKPYKTNYKHRIGMVLSKKNRATLLFKLLFTDKGIKNKQTIIKMLNENVWYNEEFYKEN